MKPGDLIKPFFKHAPVNVFVGSNDRRKITLENNVAIIIKCHSLLSEEHYLTVLVGTIIGDVWTRDWELANRK